MVCLFSVTVGLAAIHLTLTWKTDNTSLWFNSIVFGGFITSLVLDKRHCLRSWHEKAGPLSSLLGCTLLAVILLKSRLLTGGNFLNVYPFASAIGLVLLGFGFSGLIRFWKEITLLFFLGIPRVILDPIVDISLLTAHASNIILSLTGWPVSREGVWIRLPHGSIEVYSGCDGTVLITYLVGVAILFLLCIPIKGWKRFTVPFAAILIGFIVNSFRVVMMALMVNASNEVGFFYWHHGQGSHLFSMMGTVILGLFYCFLLEQNNSKSGDAKET